MNTFQDFQVTDVTILNSFSQSLCRSNSPISKTFFNECFSIFKLFDLIVNKRNVICILNEGGYLLTYFFSDFWALDELVNHVGKEM